MEVESERSTARRGDDHDGQSDRKLGRSPWWTRSLHHGLQDRLVQANRIARVVGFDIVQTVWRPTVENYLNRFPKALALHALWRVDVAIADRIEGNVPKASIRKAPGERCWPGNTQDSDRARRRLVPRAAALARRRRQDPQPRGVASPVISPLRLRGPHPRPSKEGDGGGKRPGPAMAAPGCFPPPFGALHREAKYRSAPSSTVLRNFASLRVQVRAARRLSLP